MGLNNLEKTILRKVVCIIIFDLLYNATFLLDIFFYLQT